MFGDPVTNPKGWPVKPLARLGRVTTGNTPSRAVPAYFGDDIEWIKSDNINTPSHYLTRATEGLSAQGRAVGRTAPSGSTLMTCIAGSPDCIGNVALADREVAFNQQINAVTPHGGVDYRFLYVLLLVGKRLVQAASTNGMKGMVSKGKLEDVLVPSPPANAQAKFGEAFDRVLRLSRRAEFAEREAQTLFDTAAQRAFSGDLASSVGSADSASSQTRPESPFAESALPEDAPQPVVHSRAEVGGQATGQVAGQVRGQVAGQVTEQVERLLAALSGEMKRDELQSALGLAGRDNFTVQYLGVAQQATSAPLVRLCRPAKSIPAGWN